MRLLIVRHGDPDYSIDSLTEKGWKEAEYLSERLSKLDVKDFYVSPLGRAKDTASFTLKKMNRTAVECDWLREFDVLIDRPDVTDRQKRLWDWLPQDWTQDERFYQYDHWYENERLQQSDAKGYYDYVTESLISFLPNMVMYVKDIITEWRNQMKIRWYSSAILVWNVCFLRI